MKPRIVVMISGYGTNLQALIDAWQNDELDGDIVGVVSNKKEVYGLVRAQEAGIETLYFPYGAYRQEGREAYDFALAEAVQTSFAPDLIVLAGWMRIFTPAFLSQFEHIINLHPALPGQFPGAHAIEEAYEAFHNGEITQTGCMIHYVIEALDAGPVVETAVVPLFPADTLSDVKVRMRIQEHRLIVSATQKVLQTLMGLHDD